MATLAMTRGGGVPGQGHHCTTGGMGKRKEAPQLHATTTDSKPFERGDEDGEHTPKRTKIESTGDATYRHPSGWAAIALDCLRHATTFLSLHDVGEVAPVSRTWRTAVDGLRRRADALECPSVERLRVLLGSRLRRHIGGLRVWHLGRFVDGDYHPVALAISDLLHLRASMPQLTALTVAIDCTSDLHLACSFPEGLLALEVAIRLPVESVLATPNEAAAWAHIERAMVGISQIRTLTTLNAKIQCELDGLKLSSVNMPSTAVQPLTQLRDSLLQLDLDYPNAANLHMSHDHIEVLRSLTKVTRLGVLRGMWDNEELEIMTAPPVPLHITRLGLMTTDIDDISGPAIARLTALTDFSPQWLEARDPSFLSSLTQLETVTLFCDVQVDIPLLTMALSRCPRIHTLLLSHDGMTDDQLVSLLAVLPILRDLTLSVMDRLKSLSFASLVPHLPKTLEVLVVDECIQIAPDELFHVRSLSALRKLGFTRSFSSPPDPALLATFTPSEPTFDRRSWPHLTEFNYSVPSAVADDEELFSSSLDDDSDDD